MQILIRSLFPSLIFMFNRIIILSHNIHYSHALVLCVFPTLGINDVQKALAYPTMSLHKWKEQSKMKAEHKLYVGIGKTLRRDWQIYGGSELLPLKRHKYTTYGRGSIFVSNPGKSSHEFGVWRGMAKTTRNYGIRRRNATDSWAGLELGHSSEEKASCRSGDQIIILPQVFTRDWNLVRKSHFQVLYLIPIFLSTT